MPRIEDFSGAPVRTVERPAGRVFERRKRELATRQWSEQLQGRKKILSGAAIRPAA
jgi:hypothetical protein